jgi:hypothetical protein
MGYLNKQELHSSAAENRADAALYSVCFLYYACGVTRNPRAPPK